MDKDKRQAKRKSMRYTAWLALGPGKMLGCVLHDISETGARIGVEDSKAIPDRVVLLLARNASARRPCRVKWREPRQIGVQFVTVHTANDGSKLVPKTDAPPLAPAKAQVEPAENA